MKEQKKLSALAAGAVAIGLLLGVSTVSADVIFGDPSDPNKATEIEDLNVGGTSYDVTFDAQVFAFEVYGPFPGEFFFNNATDALDAISAIVAELNAAGATSVGEVGNEAEAVAVNIGYGSMIDPILEDIQLVNTARGVCGDQCVDWTNGGTNQLLYDADERTWALFTPVGGGGTGPVDLTGMVETTDGTGLCALVLASGDFMFSCNPNGPFSLTDLPREGDGTVKRQVYVDGFFPEVDVLQNSVDETVVMTRASDCPDYNSFPDPSENPDSAGKRIDISGTVLLQDTQTPVCAIVLANGQFGFTCDGTGSYSGNIPLDNNGQFKLQVYADGFAPMVQKFDESRSNNNVRMARASECQ